jgi:hypothetical protein
MLMKFSNIKKRTTNNLVYQSNLKLLSNCSIFRQRYGTNPNVFAERARPVVRFSAVPTTIGPSPFTDQVSLENLNGPFTVDIN